MRRRREEAGGGDQEMTTSRLPVLITYETGRQCTYIHTVLSLLHCMKVDTYNLLLII